MSNSSTAVKRWRQRTKDRMIEAMGGKCQCCGYNLCTRALAFHHVNPEEKDFSFGALRANPTQWVNVVNELKKCILVCHNCHSEIHDGIRVLPTDYAVFNEEFADFKKIEEYNSCPVCNKEKPTKYKFCSSKCSSLNRRKVDWDSVDLLQLLKTHTISELEDMFNVSNAAIYKRRDKILKELK